MDLKIFYNKSYNTIKAIVDNRIEYLIHQMNLVSKRLSPEICGTSFFDDNFNSKKFSEKIIINSKISVEILSLRIFLGCLNVIREEKSTEELYLENTRLNQKLQQAIKEYNKLDYSNESFEIFKNIDIEYRIHNLIYNCISVFRLEKSIEDLFKMKKESELAFAEASGKLFLSPMNITTKFNLEGIKSVIEILEFLVNAEFMNENILKKI